MQDKELMLLPLISALIMAVAVGIFFQASVIAGATERMRSGARRRLGRDAPADPRARGQVDQGLSHAVRGRVQEHVG